MQPEKAATHEEIWDDSALVESWNEALEEYKKYHSIHAKGGTVDDLSNGADDIARSNAKPETTAPAPEVAGAEEGEVDETVPMDESGETWHPTISDTRGSGAAQKVEVAPGNVVPSMGPQVLLGTVQDENLKKLLMSWYYAGYYTGLYEGKQQAQGL